MSFKILAGYITSMTEPAHSSPSRLWNVPGVKVTHEMFVFLQMIYESMAWRDSSAFDRLQKRWNFTTESEKVRYARVNEIVRRYATADHWGRVLEIGCSSGEFTHLLAQQAGRLVATDISELACGKCRDRNPEANVHVVQMDCCRTVPQEQFDMVFAMAVLMFAHGRKRLGMAADHIAASLRQGGLFVLHDWRLPEHMRQSRWVAKWVEGFEQQVRFFSAHGDFELLGAEVDVPYGTAVFRKR